MMNRDRIEPGASGTDWQAVFDGPSQATVVDQDNPYAAPLAAVADYVPSTDRSERLRRDHIKHEVQLKSVGVLYGLGAVMMAFASISLFVTGLSASSDILVDAMIFLIMMAFTVGMGFMAYGFRKLRPWIKVPGTILSVIGLLNIGLGTLINAWILYLMLSAKGQTVLDPSYERVVRETPHVKYERSLLEKIILGIFLLLIVGLLVAMVLAAVTR